MELELASEELQGAHEVVGAPPTLVDRWWAPGFHLFQGFFIFSEKVFREVSDHSENFCFYT